MIEINEDDFDPCPDCDGKIVYLGAEKNDHGRRPIHKLFCPSCIKIWEIEVNTKRLQEAWKDICEEEKDAWRR